MVRYPSGILSEYARITDQRRRACLTTASFGYGRNINLTKTTKLFVLRPKVIKYEIISIKLSLNYILCILSVGRILRQLSTKVDFLQKLIFNILAKLSNFCMTLEKHPSEILGHFSARTFSQWSQKNTRIKFHRIKFTPSLVSHKN